jgi:hypothetical protein
VALTSNLIALTVKSRPAENRSVGGHGPCSA